MPDIKKMMRTTELSDEELFSSKVFASYLRKCIGYLCRRARRIPPRVVVPSLGPGETSFTDGELITINSTAEIVLSQETREDKLAILKGVLTHEWGHIQFSDFALLKLVHEKLRSGILFPHIAEKTRTPECDSNYEQMKDMLKEKPFTAGPIWNIYADVNNIIEDGYIEEACYRYIDGQMLDCLCFLRKYSKETFMPLGDLLAELDKGVCTLYDVISCLMLEYAKYGEFVYSKESSKEAKFISEYMAPLVDTIDLAVYEEDSFKRVGFVNVVFLKLWPLVAEMLPKSAEDKEKKTGHGRGSADSAIGSGTSSPSPAPSRGIDSKHSKRTGSAIARAETKKSFEETEDKAKDGKEGSAGDAADKGPDKGSVSPSDGPETDDSAEDAGSEESAHKSPEADLEKPDDRGEEEDVESTRKSEDRDDEEGPEETHVEYVPDWDKVAKELEAAMTRLERDGREEKAISRLEKELEKELSHDLDETSFTGPHKAIEKVIYRVSTVDDEFKETHRTEVEEARKKAHILARKLTPVLKRDDEPYPLSGFFSGNRFQAQRLVYGDYRYFSQQAAPLPKTSVAVTLLIDESGSMFGNRIEAARETAMQVYLCCRELDVPCSVIGHTESYGEHKLVLQDYADFDSPDKDDIYRMLLITQKENNRDGAAIQFCGKRLMKREERVKLLIIISDGAPLAYNYLGREAEMDMKKIISELRKKGIIIFSAAIGSDKENILRIFEEGFLDITDLEQLPGKMLQLLRHYLI